MLTIGSDVSWKALEDEKKEFDCENDTPVENLAAQLGFTKRPDLIIGHAKLPFCEIFRNSTFGETEMF